MSRALSPLSLGLLGLGGLALSLSACNQPPSSPSVELTPAAPTTVDDLVVNTITPATDPNKKDVVFTEYKWFYKSSVEQEEYTERADIEGATVPSALTSKGEAWKVEVKVTDGELAAEGTVEAETVVVNTPPQALNVQVTPQSGVNTVGMLVASAGSEDIDDDDVDLVFAWMVNGTAVEADGNTLDGTYFDKGDEVWVEVTPHDGEEAGTTVTSNKVPILNTPPRIDGVEIDPQEAFEGTTLTCNPVGWFDIDEDEANIDVTWLVNGEAVSTSATLDGSKFDKHQLVRCMGVPNDGDDVGPHQVSEPIEILNTKPSIGTVTLNDDTPKAIDEQSVTIDGTHDDDGDEVTYTYEWYVDDELVSTEEVLPRLSFIKGQKVHVVVTPHDDEEAGEPVKSNVGEAINSEPIIDSITLRPNPAYTDSTISPNIEAYDADGDRISYERTWSVNGSSVTEVGPVLKGDDWFERDDTVFVEIVPSDGTDKGKSVKSDTLTIANSPPTKPSIYIDPEEPDDSKDLWCVIDEESVDADEDDLTYTIEWTRNGSAFTGATTTDYEGDTVEAKHTVDKDTWVCTVTVDDGIDEVSVTATAEILNWAGPRNFTNCGKTGYAGPTSCTSTYAGTALEGAVTLDKGWQIWEVPQDGTYRIEAWGAQGGKGRYGSYGGGYGARMRGDFALKAGEKLYIAVGQKGQSGSGSYSSGGGGASWVMKGGRSSPLLVAAGGGGNGYGYYNATISCGGQTTGYPRYGGSSSFSGCSTYYRSSGYGGSYYSRLSGSYYYYYGGGGAGFRTDGSNYNSGWRAYSAQHSSYPARGANTSYADGGFGGGGGGGYIRRYRYYPYYTYYYSSYGNGGGGGYTGGHGSYYRGGGGSGYNGGSTQSNTAANRSGDGKVTIDLAP